MPSSATRRSPLAILLILAALLAPGSASADSVVTELARDTPISAYGGALAWSSYDEATKRYALVIRHGGDTAAAPVATARRAFDVSLGPDGRGRVVALYTRCETATRGCDVYRYDLRRRRESRLRSVSSPAFDEAWPAQWRGRIAFARRARTRVVDGYTHRPDPRGRGPVLECDIPFVKIVSSASPSRRLDRSRCGLTAGMAIRGEAIVHVAGIDQGGAGSESQVRLLRARGGAARILARTTGGEGGYSPFVAPTLSQTAVWLTRTGRREGIQPGFVRIDLASAQLTTSRAQLNFTGSTARDDDGRFWYVQGPEPDFDGELQCGFVLEPCRLVRASASPFSATPRKLLPRLTVDGAPIGFISAFAADPPVLSGALSRAIVRRGVIVGREAMPGVAVSLLRTASSEVPGPFTPTGMSTTTDATGRWAFALASPPPEASLTAVAPALRVATGVVVIQALSRIALSASGRTLSGIVAPAQPGRTVEIQRLTVDARGRKPGGQQVCSPPVTAQSCLAPDAWPAVAQAPLDVAGTAFSATVIASGDYRARLAFETDARGVQPAYGGISPAVRVP